MSNQSISEWVRIVQTNSPRSFTISGCEHVFPFFVGKPAMFGVHTVGLFLKNCVRDLDEGSRKTVVNIHNLF